MRIVLDASVAAHIAVDGPKADRYREAVETADEVLAPELIIPELINAIWKGYRFSNLTLGACDSAIELGLTLIDSLVSGRELYREAFLLARVNRRPAYDMFYLALAARENATLATLDSRLKELAERQGIPTL
jgi:predicted nucleic acid-binding protein